MKNTNKKSKKKMQATFKIEKSIFKKVIKANFQTSANCGISNLLSGIKFEFENGALRIISTDGNRLLVNEITVEEAEGACEAIYNGVMLGKIQFLKNICIHSEHYVDYLEFTMTPENLRINDPANKIVYVVDSIDGQYPKYKQLFPNLEKAKENEYTQIALNVSFVEDLKRMSVNPRTNIIKFAFKNNSPLSVVTVESVNESEGVESKSIIMPIQIR